MKFYADTAQGAAVKNRLSNPYCSQDTYYYEAISDLTKAGSWSVDFINKKSFLDRQARKILKVPNHYIPSLKDGNFFYADEDMAKAEELFLKCSGGSSFTTEIQMKTYADDVFWARAQGQPIRDNKGNVVGIRGVFQNIEVEIQKENSLKASLGFVEDHNKWLQDFANIVAHTLRSHISNLQLSTTLFEDDDLGEDQKLLFSNIRNVGDHLDTSLKHLDTLIALQNVDQTFQDINVEEKYKKVIAKVIRQGIQIRPVFYTEFSEVEVIYYISAYFESILYNLITNAILHRSKERDPEIKVFTYEEFGYQHLVVQDNGIGIDDQLKDCVLTGNHRNYLYCTKNDGFELFLVKCQVEALQGEMTIESKPGKGSKVTIQFSKQD